jgi:hypothetical protein
MPQETHTKPTHSAGMVCCRGFEPFGNCFSATNCDCAGESTCSRGPVGHMRQSHKGVPCPARADGAHNQGLVCCVAEPVALAAKSQGCDPHGCISPACCVAKWSGCCYEQWVQPMDRPTPPSCWWVARSMLGCHKRPTQCHKRPTHCTQKCRKLQ